MAKTPASAKIQRKKLAEAAGLRPLNAKELVALGFRKDARQYTSQKAGIKLSSLRRDKVINRRKAEQSILGKSFEKISFENARKRSFRLPRYSRYAKIYAMDVLGLTEKQYEAKPSLIKNDPTFKRLYKEATTEKYKIGRNGRRVMDARGNYVRDPETAQKRVQALYDLGVADKDELPEVYLDGRT